MNYRHAFHAGNHADVLKHVALLALCDALTSKPTPVFALDTHAGRGLYRIDDESARRTGEAEGGIARLDGHGSGLPAPVLRYVRAVDDCRREHGAYAYPGSPWLLAHALRPQDRIACCELQPEEAGALRAHLGRDPRLAVHERDGYAAMRALLPPRTSTERIGRGLVLIDPPFEKQLDEYDHAIRALRDGLERWAPGTYALWYPIKQRRALQPAYRRFATLPARSVLLVELLVRADDSPLRMNGSGLLVLNAPWRFDESMRESLRALVALLGEAGASSRVDWLKPPA